MKEEKEDKTKGTTMGRDITATIIDKGAIPEPARDSYLNDIMIQVNKLQAGQALQLKRNDHKTIHGLTYRLGKKLDKKFFYVFSRAKIVYVVRKADKK